ncbi:polysaccharide pyruvyl transferase family protein [Gramella lutea]|uniref:Polysaccharide pyruvyl transferase family protein n=1 Tax=Christiangramia lutea TaxID=1607951 RepID=A0A9X1V369_9FLAO|nr:polysaccharide pyruvyl transferase family protein [Christiangramia lutea]MCH4823552.1 polysaccharide pyruvyl transferase family protein [Christiangramia lutea]
MVKKFLNSLERKKSRRRSLKRIRNSVQSNEDVINIHRINKQNVGDFYCAPHHYFDSLKNTELDIFLYRETEKEKQDHFVNTINKNSLIVGGGGLLNRGSFEKQMKLFEELAQRGKKIVFWGAGHNSKKTGDFKKLSNYNIDISRFGLSGTRDFTGPGEYVPCVSCMHPVFDREYSVENEVGIVFHTKSLKDEKLLQKFSILPSSANNDDIEELSGFIGSCEHLITNSYHAMYWGMILNKKVTVVPNSSKFYDFKYAPNISTFEDCLDEYKKARAYTGIREESIEINKKFYMKVADYLKL